MPVPTAVGDIVELVLKSNWDNQVEFNNVFHYRITNAGTGDGSPATLDEWAAGFYQNVLTALNDLVHENQHFTSIVANLRDADSFALISGEILFITPAINGVASGDAMPPFVCWTYKYLRETTAFRHGFKRFGALAEGQQLNGLPASSMITPLTNFAITLSAPLEAWTLSGGVPDAQVTAAAAEVVVPARIRSDTLLDPVLYSVVPQVVFDRVGSQNSRKFGVGV
jgi:hypothetical protein